MGKKRKRPSYQHNDRGEDFQYEYRELEVPKFDGAHLYQMKSQLPWDISRYWPQRHSMFSLYDEGIWTTDDSWFEVTHESVARTIADHVAFARPKEKIIMLDCFAGIGGNAIAFALSGAYRRVYAIEKNAAALECAKQNAKIYGVHDKITFFHGDCFDILGLNGHKEGTTVDVLSKVIGQAGIIFASPPWGGPGYKDTGDVFDLDLMPYTLDYMYLRFTQITKNVVLYLPRTSDLDQLANYVEDGCKTQVVHYCQHEKSRALCVYYGEWKDVIASGINGAG